MTTHQITAEELVACQAAVFEWAESFDSKDWARLSECIAPTLYVDYRAVMGMIWEAMPAEDFINLVNAAAFLGNQKIKTQHFIGATKWVKASEDKIIGHHQMRVAHQRYKDEDLKEVLHQGHAHGKATIHYSFVNGSWKFAGLVPEIRWSEHEYDKIFRD